MTGVQTCALPILHKAYDEASKVLGTPDRISPLIEDHLENRPIVARRHYIKTGNLRYFEVRYLPIPDLKSSIEDKSTRADGLIIVPLCETNEERDKAIKFARKKVLKDHPSILVAIPKPLLSIAKLVQEVRRWEWISQNTAELNNDAFAAEEVSRQINAASQVLQKRLQSFVGLRQFTEKMELDWYLQNKKLKIDNCRDMLSELSKICDEVYSKAPLIRNELVNRQQISAAASSARTRLIDNMFKNAHEPILGMDPTKKPPEMSMYLSVLRASGLHQQSGAEFDFSIPTPKQDVCKISPSFDRLAELLQDKPDTRVKVTEIISALQEPPYGVRGGLIPILLAAFSIIHEHEVALYEKGAFVPNVSGTEFIRLVKAPADFEIQFCKITGIRSTLFKRLLDILELKTSSKRKSDVLDVVRPLCVFAAQLPEYSKNSSRLSKNAIRVRKALLESQEPATLIFKELPKACGFEAFGTKDIKDKKIVNRSEEHTSELQSHSFISYAVFCLKKKNKKHKKQLQSL